MSDGDGEFGHAVARGVVAAMAMSGLRRLTTGLGFIQEEPPEQIAREGVPGLLERVPPDLRAEAIELAHWTYGGVGGAAFGALPTAVRRQSWAHPRVASVRASRDRGRPRALRFRRRGKGLIRMPELVRALGVTSGLKGRNPG